jgi:TatA/E family protein of Tat protein translocase
MAAEPSIVVGLFDLGSGAHWLIILFVALLLFGRKLPEMMRGLGGSIREFKKGMDEVPPPDPRPPTSMQPPAPHIDGAVSRPSDPVPPPADDAHPAASEPPAGHEPVNPYARPDDPPKHH